MIADANRTSLVVAGCGHSFGQPASSLPFTRLSPALADEPGAVRAVRMPFHHIGYRPDSLILTGSTVVSYCLVLHCLLRQPGRICIFPGCHHRRPSPLSQLPTPTPVSPFPHSSPFSDAIVTVPPLGFGVVAGGSSESSRFCRAAACLSRHSINIGHCSNSPHCELSLFTSPVSWPETCTFNPTGCVPEKYT